MSDPTTPVTAPGEAARPGGPVAEPLGERAAGTLRLLVEGASGVLGRVLAAPAGLDVPVRGTVIHDPGDPLPPSPAAVLLLVGTDVTDPRACAVLRQAAGRGFAAAVVKERGQDPARLAETAEACGIAVLAAGDAVPWRQVDAELSCALAAYGIGGAAGAAPAGGAELFALADTLAAVAGGSVAIEDLDQNVVAYSKVPGQRIDALRERGILQRRVPDLPEQRGQYREVLAAPGVVRFPAYRDELARAAVAVRAGALPLGTLWAIEPADGLSDEAVAALRDTARLAAPHLLRALYSPETERRLRRDTFRAVLHGAGPPADEAAERLGLRPGTEFTLAAFALPAPARGYGTEPSGAGWGPNAGAGAESSGAAWRPKAGSGAGTGVEPFGAESPGAAWRPKAGAGAEPSRFASGPGGPGMGVSAESSGAAWRPKAGAGAEPSRFASGPGGPGTGAGAESSGAVSRPKAGSGAGTGVESFGAESSRAVLLGHLESVLVRHCAAHREAATVAATVDAAYVLLPATGTAAARRFADAALAVVRPAVGDGVRAAVTRPRTALQPAALRREADDVLRATAGDGPGRPAATAGDVRHRILLDRLGDELDRAPWLRLPGVAALLSHDHEHGTAYAATLTAWLDEVGDVASAAARLTVHPNTLRHRLRRIRELFPLDLDDPDVRLAVWLDLRREAPG